MKLEEIELYDIQHKWLHKEEHIRSKVKHNRLTNQDKKDQKIIEQVKKSFEIYILLLKIGLDME